MEFFDGLLYNIIKNVRLKNLTTSAIARQDGMTRIHILTTMTAMIANPKPIPFLNSESVADIAEAISSNIKKKGIALTLMSERFLYFYKSQYSIYLILISSPF